MERPVGVIRFQRSLDGTQLMADLLEPQLVDLVDDDEEELVVLGAIGADRPLDLQREQLRHLEVGRVRDGSAGHPSMVRAGLSSVGGSGR